MKGKKIVDSPMYFLKSRKMWRLRKKMKYSIREAGIKRKEVRDTTNEPFLFVKQERKTAYEQEKENQCKTFLLTAC